MQRLDWQYFGAIAWPLLVALALGLLVRRLLLAAARRARARAATRTRARVVEVIAVPAAVALPLLFLALAVAATPLQPEPVARIQHWLGIGVLLCVTWLLVRAVDAIELRILDQNPVDIEDNLAARRVQTQTRVVAGVIQGAIVLVGVSLALMTFPAIRQIGATLLASAGLIGLVAGFAAKPVFGNLIAGLQIALTQPIRLDDVVIVEGEWGRVEEITSAYVVVRIWDQRRLVVPLQWFIENPFQNWTRTSAEILGPVFLWLDHGTRLDGVREELQRICASDPRWDGRVCVVHVEDITAEAMKVRLLVSARNSGDDYDLRAAVRERMLAYLRREAPEALPRLRAALSREPDGRADAEGAASARSRDDAACASPTSSPSAEDGSGTVPAARGSS